MKSGPWVIAGATLVCAAGMLVSVAIQAGRPHRGFPEGSRTVEIKQGASARAAAETLEQAGVIRSALVFRLLIKLRGAGENIHAGEYEFTALMTPNEVLEKLLKGDALTHRLTIPEGLRLDEVADLVAASSFGDRAAFLRAAGRPDLSATWTPRRPISRGIFFPRPTSSPRAPPRSGSWKAMVSASARRSPLRRWIRARALGFSLRQAVTLASLIEEEAGVDEERAHISAVFHNRLHREMLLQCDPPPLCTPSPARADTGEKSTNQISHSIHPGTPTRAPACRPARLQPGRQVDRSGPPPRARRGPIFRCERGGQASLLRDAGCPRAGGAPLPQGSDSQQETLTQWGRRPLAPGARTAAGQPCDSDSVLSRLSAFCRRGPMRPPRGPRRYRRRWSRPWQT